MQEDKDTILQDYIKYEKLDQVERLYRYTNAWHVKRTEGADGTLAPNPGATEMLEDMYASGHTMMASDIGSGLSFLKDKDNDFKVYDRICVSIDLADFVKQGGYIYPDKSTYAEGAYFCMLPKGEFKVTIEE